MQTAPKHYLASFLGLGQRGLVLALEVGLLLATRIGGGSQRFGRIGALLVELARETRGLVGQLEGQGKGNRKRGSKHESKAADTK